MFSLLVAPLLRVTPAGFRSKVTNTAPQSLISPHWHYGLLIAFVHFTVRFSMQYLKSTSGTFTKVLNEKSAKVYRTRPDGKSSAVSATSSAHSEAPRSSALLIAMHGEKNCATWSAWHACARNGTTTSNNKLNSHANSSALTFLLDGPKESLGRP